MKAAQWVVPSDTQPMEDRAEKMRAWFEMRRLQPPVEPAGGAATPMEALGGQVLAEAGREALLERAARAALDAGDDEAAAALVVAGLLLRWETGRRLDVPAPWLPLADELLESARLSPLAAAALSVHRLVAGQLGRVPLDVLLTDLPTLRRRVEATDSVPIRLLAAAAQINLHALAGQLHQARECLRDAATLAIAEPPQGAAPVHLATKAALLVALDVDVGEPARRLLAMAEAADLSVMPVHVRLAARAHQLLCLARAGDVAAADRLAEELRGWVVPARRAYHHSLLHYALGVADLTAGQPQSALWHAERAMEVGQISGSQTAELIPALLRLQALADLGRRDEAEALFQNCLPQWLLCGMRLQAANARQERTLWCEKAGLVPPVSSTQEQGLAHATAEKELPRLHRGAMSSRQAAATAEVTAQLHPTIAKSQQATTAHIMVRTFGQFILVVDGHRLGDNDWRGRKTRDLLKLLIAHGGKASVESLCDALWPEADGAHARQNLKVAVWRLRRIGLAERPAAAEKGSQPWVTLRQGMVGLDPQLCCVDALQLLSLPAADVTEDSVEVLDLFDGEFLPGDEAPVISACRERLQAVFVTAALAEAGQALRSGIRASLHRAQQRIGQVLLLRPDWEPGYALWRELQLAAASVPLSAPTPPA